jgi:hypothetical protein
VNLIDRLTEARRQGENLKSQHRPAVMPGAITDRSRRKRR